jgi:hypothetical protein
MSSFNYYSPRLQQGTSGPPFRAFRLVDKQTHFSYDPST